MERAAFFEEAAPSKPSPGETFPSRCPPVERIANDSALPAGDSRGSPFSGGGKQKNKSISPYKAICPAYQKTGRPPWVARFLMVWVYSCATCQLLPLLFTGHGSLPTASCSLLITYSAGTRKAGPAFRNSATRARQSAVLQNPIRLKKDFPGAGPRAYRICNTVCKTGGPVPGKFSQGEAWRGLPLRKRRPLQGLSHRWDS